MRTGCNSADGTLAIGHVIQALQSSIESGRQGKSKGMGKGKGRGSGGRGRSATGRGKGAVAVYLERRTIRPGDSTVLSSPR